VSPVKDPRYSRTTLSRVRADGSAQLSLRMPMCRQYYCATPRGVCGNVNSRAIKKGVLHDTLSGVRD
jgi:hypothetical protein